MNKKVRILHILWSGHTGGAEKFTDDIVRHADSLLFENHVFFLSEEGIFAERIREHGGFVACLGMRHGYDIIKFVKIIGLLSKLQPDIIVVHCV